MHTFEGVKFERTFEYYHLHLCPDAQHTPGSIYHAKRRRVGCRHKQSWWLSSLLVKRPHIHTRAGGGFPTCQHVAQCIPPTN